MIFMSEYVKIKRRLYDELVDTKAKYETLRTMVEGMINIYERSNKQEEKDIKTK